MMKTSGISPVWLAVAALLLVGCHSLSPPDAEIISVDDLLLPPVVTPHRDWLLVRLEICRQSIPEQRARMMELTVETITAEERMERLLLATCHPESTPGLLREALAGFDSLAATESEQALVNLLRDHARSYRLLEEKNARLAAQLEATINGIRDIETEMDALRPIRVLP